MAEGEEVNTDDDSMIGVIGGFALYSRARIFQSGARSRAPACTCTRGPARASAAKIKCKCGLFASNFKSRADTKDLAKVLNRRSTPLRGSGAWPEYAVRV